MPSDSGSVYENMIAEESLLSARFEEHLHVENSLGSIDSTYFMAEKWGVAGDCGDIATLVLSDRTILPELE
jgi:hypothetical protein